MCVCVCVCGAVARKGDRLAQQVFWDAGEILGAHVKALVPQAEVPPSSIPGGLHIVAVGSVLNHCWDLLREGEGVFSLTHSSLTHSFTDSLTHSPTHPLTRLPVSSGRGGERTDSCQPHRLQCCGRSHPRSQADQPYCPC